MQKILIFDFDGTVCDSFDECFRALNALAPRYKYKALTPEELSLVRTRGTQEAFEYIGISKIKLPFIVRDIRRHLSEHLNTLHPFPDIPEVLSELRETGATLGILTSNSEKNVKEFLIREEIQVDFIHAGSSIFGKGHVLKKLLRAKFSKTSPSLIYYIGDETRDIAAAKQAGIQSVAVQWGFAREAVLRSSEPTLFAENPQDLLELLRPTETRIP